MGLQKKLVLSLSALMFASVAACSSNNITAPGNIKGGADFSRVNSLSSPNVRVVSDEIAKDHIIIDVGQGKKTGASISVKVNLQNGSEFKVKSSDGTPAKTLTNMLSIKFWLVTSTVGTPPSGAIVAGNIKSSASVDTSAAGPHVATFTNVPDNTGGEAYYVLASAFSVVTTSQAAGNNITNTGATASFGTGAAYVSNAGGDPSNLGSVGVAGFKLFPTTGATADLGIPLKLLDGVGATVTGATTVQPGGYVGSITPSAT